MWSVVVALCFVALGCSLASTASSATSGLGGSSISTARALPLGRLVTSGWVNSDAGEFFRVSLHTGDRITLDYGLVGQSCGGIEVRIYAPNVNDFTIGNSDSQADSSTGSNQELIWVAPVNGSWIVHFSDCSTNSYRFRAAVKAYRVPVVTGSRTIARARPLP